MGTRDAGIERREMAHTADHLRSSNEELLKFAGIVSHELCEPLRTIATYGQLLRNRTSNAPELAALSANIIDAVGRTNALLDSLLSYSNAANGCPDLSHFISLDGALQVAILNLSSAIADSGAEITSEPLPDVPADLIQITRYFRTYWEMRSSTVRPSRQESMSARGEKTRTGSYPVETTASESTRDTAITFSVHSDAFTDVSILALGWGWRSAQRSFSIMAGTSGWIQTATMAASSNSLFRPMATRVRAAHACNTRPRMDENVRSSACFHVAQSQSAIRANKSRESDAHRMRSSDEAPQTDTSKCSDAPGASVNGKS